MQETIKHFTSRLETLSMLLDLATVHFDNDEFLKLRLVEDMLPMTNQIAFACNQPHNFVQWIRDEEISHLSSDFDTVAEAKQLIQSVVEELAELLARGTALPEEKHLELGPEYYAVLPANEYISDYLIPNFYFHLVIAYDILRANGVAIGKAEYMAHLRDRVRPKAQ